MKIVHRGKYFSCKGYIKLKLAKVPTTFTVKPVLSFLEIFCQDQQKQGQNYKKATLIKAAYEFFPVLLQMVK